MTRASDLAKIITDADISGTLDVTGETTLATHLNLGDGDKIKLGASGDLEIYHNGSNSFIEDVGTGALVIRGANELYLQSTASNNYFQGQSGGAVTLYHNNNAKFATTSSGVDVTGEISADGEIDCASSSSLSTISATATGSCNLVFGTNFSGSTSQGMVNQSGFLNMRQDFPVLFGTSETERMRIFGSGNITFSTTNQSPAEGTAVGARIGTTGKVQLSAASAACLQANRSDNNGDVIVFRRGGTVCGEIAVNGDSQTTAYQTSSDYRLKENVSYDFDATARLKQLKPARFNWISDKNNITVDGFLAHEVSSIVPEAIGGEKDGTQELDDVVLNSDGTVNSSEITEKDWVVGKEDKTYADDTTWVASKTVPKYQGIDQAKLVPLLVKTIQELEARITALEGA